jgi:uncharacterized protein YecE (DUF72 family)
MMSDSDACNTPFSNTNAEQNEAPIRVGTMGWGYTDWTGVFYPAKAASKDYISLYSRRFNCVEIDSTFYGTPRENQVRQWRAQTPEDFVFCPKVPRQITHDLRLVNVADMLREFVRVMGLLGPKRGPMLLQMPPDFTRAELGALEAFLPTIAGYNDPTVRFAIEFRHRSWLGADISDLLRGYGVALASTDYVIMPRRYELTADFVYLRLIGRHGQYPKNDQLYGDREGDMQRWAEVLLRSRTQYTAAYVLINNEYEGYAPETAVRMKRLLGLPEAELPRDIQGSLF